jgi:FtsP/CotA-like multicopper oxidase with cupredoxin domain
MTGQKMQHLIRIWSNLILIVSLMATTAFAVPLPGGTLDPLTIPKYVQPLVIPPVMPKAVQQPLDPATGAPYVGATATDYNIAVRQFKQQILPGGAWNLVNGRADAFPPTPIWSYGPEEIPAADVAAAVSPMPLNANNALGLPATPTGYFNYPSFTIEQTSQEPAVAPVVPTTIRWINDLVDPATGNYRPHLLTGTVDQTLHWANPPNTGCINTFQGRQIDCATTNAAPYTGPVPIVTHVHGAHVNAESDGYPEAWWLPAANNIPAGYATTGTLYTQNDAASGLVQGAGNPTDIDPVPGAAIYSYENTQPASTIWYHDHSLGMTRLNVYAGPAGFFLIRGGAYDGATNVDGTPAVLPGPAPALGEDPNFVTADRVKIREIPIAIQDRSFNADGSLFYPQSRAFFDGYTGPYVGMNQDTAGQNFLDPNSPSDMAPIWNPEAFFNTMVVNGTTWPKLDVAPAKYRFRLLNGSNSRFINLAMFTVDPATNLTTPVELPFYQIGADQGFLPEPVEISTGFVTARNAANMTANQALIDQANLDFDTRIAAAQAAADAQILSVTTTMDAQLVAVTANITAQIAALQVRLDAATLAGNATQIANLTAAIATKQALLVTRTADIQAALDARILTINTNLTNRIATLEANRATRLASLNTRMINQAFKPRTRAPHRMQGLLMAPAERADVIVDFGALPAGTIVRMINTAPDAPFGGFPDIPADVDTSGQVMQFIVNQPVLASDATTTDPALLTPNAEVYDPANAGQDTVSSLTVPSTVIATPRVVSLNEEESFQNCVNVSPAGVIGTQRLSFTAHNPNIVADCAAVGLVPQAPKAALLGLIAADPTQPGSPLVGVPHLWKDPITENPALNTSEFWDFYNLTVDGHPIHMHLVRYKIIHRQVFDPLSPTFAPVGPVIPALPTEAGMKDTVLSYPGEITRVQATFNLPGLYVWHCHIVEHEDNEMMRPFHVGPIPVGFPVP